jgi:hypothetical protein
MNEWLPDAILLEPGPRIPGAMAITETSDSPLAIDLELCDREIDDGELPSMKGDELYTTILGLHTSLPARLPPFPFLVGNPLGNRSILMSEEATMVEAGG